MGVGESGYVWDDSPQNRMMGKRLEPSGLQWSFGRGGHVRQGETGTNLSLGLDGSRMAD